MYLKYIFSLLLLTSNSINANYFQKSKKTPQDSTLIKPSVKIKELYANQDFNKAIVYGSKALKDLLQEKSIDSLEIANVYQYFGKSYYSQQNYLACLKAIETALAFCNDTEARKNLKK